ncbi:unnamed protein product, partial [Thlaspi arvense]
MSYGSLKNWRFWISLNEFDNSIFPFLGAAKSLKTLYLQNNKMDGPFPLKELQDLTKLELLDLSRNKFNGSISVQVLPALRKLIALDLSNNEFSGSMELQGKFTYDFHGFVSCRDLQELVISNNKLLGQFPLCITSLSKLRVLDLSSNQLNGEVPSDLGNIIALEYISLLDNNFQGFFSLSSIANLSELRVFKLSSNSNSLQLVLESSWQPKFQLSVIELRFCNLEKVPHFLLHQNDLRHVDLSHNKIPRNFSSWLLANNTNLEALLLRNNSLTIFQLPESAHKLIYLDVSVNKFNHSVPNNIGLILPHLRYMDLANNDFQGNLPSSIVSTGSCQDDEFYGYDYGVTHHNGYYIPSFSHVPNFFSTENVGMYFKSLLVVDMFNMDYLARTHAKIEFATKHRYDAYMGGNLKLLFGVDLSRNELIGEIPKELGGLVELQALNLSHNNLSGVITKSFSRIKYVESLDLSFNRLQGRIPPQLTDLSRLAIFNQFRIRDSRFFINQPINGVSAILGNKIGQGSVDFGTAAVEKNKKIIEVNQATEQAAKFPQRVGRAWFFIVDAFIRKVRNLL